MPTTIRHLGHLRHTCHSQESLALDTDYNTRYVRHIEPGRRRERISCNYNLSRSPMWQFCT